MNKIDRYKILIRYAISMEIAANQKEFGRMLGYTNESSFSQIINGKVNEPKDFILKISKIVSDLNIDWLLTGEGEMLKSGAETAGNSLLDTQKDKVLALNKLIADIQTNGKQRDKIHFIPLINIDAVGGVCNDVCDAAEYVEELIPVTGARDSSVCLPVSGDSMMPIFNPGDLVVIDEVVEWMLFLEMGQYYVIALKDNRRLIKKVTYSEEDKKQQFLLVSENPKYPPVELPKSLIHRVFIVTQKHQKLTL